MPPTVEQIVIANIRRLREARGLSQAELGNLGAKAGARMSENRIWAVENHRRRVTVNDLAALAEVLGTTPERLMSPDPEEPASTSQRYAVTVDNGAAETVTEVVTADRSEVDADGWLNFYLRGERAFFTPAARVLCVRAAGQGAADV